MNEDDPIRKRRRKMQESYGLSEPENGEQEISASSKLFEFIWKFSLSVFLMMICVAIVGYFLGEVISDALPHDTNKVYNGYAAAKAAANKGHYYMDFIESIVVTTGALYLFWFFKKRIYKPQLNKQSI